MEPDLITDPTAQQVAEVERGLGEYDLQFLPGRSGVAIKGVLVESDRVVAGLYGEMFWGKMHIRLLWVHPDRRQRGLGRRMMTWAEQRSRELGCSSVTVETMSFQAPGFYAALGYRQIGLSQGYERNASRHYFDKDLLDKDRADE